MAMKLLDKEEREDTTKNALLPTDFLTENSQISVGNANYRPIFR